MLKDKQVVHKRRGGYGWGYMISPIISPPSISITWLYSDDFLESRSVGRSARQIWLLKYFVLKGKEQRASFVERSASCESSSPTNGSAIFVGRFAFCNRRCAIGSDEPQQIRRMPCRQSGCDFVNCRDPMQPNLQQYARRQQTGSFERCGRGRARFPQGRFWKELQ